MPNNSTSTSRNPKPDISAGKQAEQRYREKEAERVKQNALASPDELCKELQDKKPRSFKRKGQSTMEGDGQNITAGVQLDNVFDAAAKKSTTEEISFLNQIINRAERRIKELKSVVPPLPLPDSTGESYKLFVPRSDALDHLSTVWGRWLKHYNPQLRDRDYLYQDQLGERDPRFLGALRTRFSNDLAQGKSKAKIGDIVPPQFVRSILEVEELDPGVKKNLVRLGGVVTRHNL